MNQNRRLSLRREIMTSLDPDALRSVAAGQPDTVNLQCVARLSDCIVISASILCPPSQGALNCPTSVDPNSCYTLFC